MQVALFGKIYMFDFEPYAQVILKKLMDYDAEIFVHADILRYFRNNIKENQKINIFFEKNELPPKLDFFISIGGDGTFLDAILYVKDSMTPMLGINSGRLGFLANVAKKRIEISLDKLFNGKYKIETRVLLKLESKMDIFGDNNFALNELTIHKKDSASMITVHAYMNGEYLNSYWADGLIIATPTGSTAYSLSVGGPLVVPNSANFIISPIAPHNLTVRPLVVPDNFEFTFEVESRNKQFLIAMDSRSESINEGIELKIKKAKFGVNIIHFDDQTFYKTLRNKLMWGIDRRN